MYHVRYQRPQKILKFKTLISHLILLQNSEKALCEEERLAPECFACKCPRNLDYEVKLWIIYVIYQNIIFSADLMVGLIKTTACSNVHRRTAQIRPGGWSSPERANVRTRKRRRWPWRWLRTILFLQRINLLIPAGRFVKDEKVGWIFTFIFLFDCHCLTLSRFIKENKDESIGMIINWRHCKL